MDEQTKLKLKASIATAGSVEEADSILTAATGLKTFDEKKAFLCGLFDCGVSDISRVIYYHMLGNIQKNLKNSSSLEA